MFCKWLRNMKFTIPDSERPHLTKTLALFAGVVVTWAVLHDIHLAQIEPRHFSEYHRELLAITNPILLAIQYAVVATLGPGLAFGFLAYTACRLGSRQKARLVPACAGFVGVLIVVEVALRFIGHSSREMVLAGKNPLYPLALYPELSPGIVYTQTVNISAYLLAPTAGSLYLACLYFRRKRQSAL
jgi:hypothetical protein